MKKRLFSWLVIASMLFTMGVIMASADGLTVTSYAVERSVLVFNLSENASGITAALTEVEGTPVPISETQVEGSKITIKPTEKLDISKKYSIILKNNTTEIANYQISFNTIWEDDFSDAEKFKTYGNYNLKDDANTTENAYSLENGKLALKYNNNNQSLYKKFPVSESGFDIITEMNVTNSSANSAVYFLDIMLNEDMTDSKDFLRFIKNSGSMRDAHLANYTVMGESRGVQYLYPDANYMNVTYRMKYNGPGTRTDDYFKLSVNDKTYIEKTGDYKSDFSNYTFAIRTANDATATDPTYIDDLLIYSVEVFETEGKETGAVVSAGENPMIIDNNVVGSFKLKNIGVADINNAKLMVAGYNGNKMTGMKIVDVNTLKPGRSDVYTYRFPVSGTTTDVKAFLWESVGNMKPLSNTANAQVKEAAFYVATNGNDENDGSIDAPFATVSRAAEAVSTLKSADAYPSEGMNVYIRGGEYNLNTLGTVTLTSENSGEEGAPVVYQAYSDETPVFTGELDISERFAPLTDDTNTDARITNISNIYVADVSDVSDLGNVTRKLHGIEQTINDVEVFVDGTPLITARYPNKVNGKQQYLKVAADGTKSTLYYSDDYIETLTDTSGIIVEGYMYQGYQYEGETISSIDKANNVISFAEPNAHPTRKDYRYLYTNVLQALDTDGEYYVDKANHKIYMYSSSALDGKSIKLSTFAGTNTGNNYKSMLYLDGASNVTIKGLTFENTRGNGIYIRGGANNLVDDCIVRNVGLNGIVIGCVYANNMAKFTDGMFAFWDHQKIYDPEKPWYGPSYPTYKSWDIANTIASSNHGITNCEVYNAGGNGVSLIGGDRFNLVPAGHYLTNTKIHDSSDRLYRGDGLVKVEGVGITVSNCDIYNTPGVAILAAGNDIKIHHNDIYNAASEVTDYGVIYSGPTPGAEIQAGTEISYNYIHDIDAEISDDIFANEPAGSVEYPEVALKMAIYNDYCNPFLEVHHNIFENMPRGLVNGGGAENNWKDNLFIDVAVPMRVQYNDQLFKTLYTKEDNSWVYDTTQSNLFTTYGSNEFIYFDVENGAWAAKYPKVAEVKRQIIDRGPDAILPSSTITGNVCVFIGKGDVYSEYGKTAEYYYNKTGDSNVVTGDYMDPNIMMQNGQKTLKEGRADYCTINNTYSMNANAIQNAMTNLKISKDMAGIQ